MPTVIPSKPNRAGRQSSDVDRTALRVTCALVVVQAALVALEIMLTMPAGTTLAESIVQATATQTLFDLTANGLF